MPPSGCYFSRDNKNYRLSGLENNRSSGLPPDRGLHSLSLDTQAVAALFSPLSIFSSFFAHSLPLFLFFQSPAAFRALLLVASSLRRLRLTFIPRRRCALGYPIRRPLRDHLSALSPHGAPSQHLRGRLPSDRSSPASSRLSFNLKSLACTPNHYNRRTTLSLYMLHIISYKLHFFSACLSLSFSLEPTHPPSR